MVWEVDLNRYRQIWASYRKVPISKAVNPSKYVLLVAK